MSTKKPNRRPAGPGRQEKENPTPRTQANTPRTSSSTERVRSTPSRAPRVKKDLIFNRNNYILLGAAGLAMALGIILMSGGSQPDPNKWDENIIYGFRPMVLAPIMMLGGVVLGIVAIFRK